MLGGRFTKFALFGLIPIFVVALAGLYPIHAGSTQIDGGTEADSAQPSQPKDVYYRAKITKILEEGLKNFDGEAYEHQKMELEILNGDNAGKKITIDHGGSFILAGHQKYKAGSIVVISKPTGTGGGSRDEFYYIIDIYRLPRLLWLVAIFFTAAIFFGRSRGATSIIGLLFSVLVIFYYIIPQIIAGENPLIMCVLGALVILTVSLFLSHGFNRRTAIALASSLIILALAVVVDLLFVYWAGLTGTGTEEAFYLQIDKTTLNLRGILLGGILIGVLGVLDDVTTGQAAAIEELSLANEKLSFAELYYRGLSIGREHIASLINTLVLAYAGASFPFLILFSLQKNQPLWMTLNSDFIAEELVRTLVGSLVLVIAVPLTGLLAAYFFSRKTRLVPAGEPLTTPKIESSLAERKKIIEHLWKK